MRMGVNERRSRENRKVTRNERMAIASRWFFRKGILIIAVPLVILAAGWFAWQGIQKLEFSKIIVLKKVEVEGNRMLAWENVLTAAKIELGVPMIDLDVKKIQESLERLDLVQSAEVHRSIPATLKIRLVEAQPLFMESGTKGWEVYSDKGTRVPFRQDLGMQLPVVLSNSKVERKRAVKFLCKMRMADPELFSQASQVVVRSDQNAMEVFFRNARHKVYFAPDGALDAFYQYRLLVQSLGKELQGAMIVDMRFPGLAVAKPGNREKENG